MYTFEKTSDYAFFDSFSEYNGGSIYQTSMWANVKSAWNPLYYVGYDNDKAVLCCLCLERKIPFLGKLWYCPNGFVCDYGNGKLIKEFATFIKSEMKKHCVFAFSTDPLIIKKINGVPRSEYENSVLLFIDAGFKFSENNSFYTVQPSTTINVCLSSDGERFSEEQILKKCDKGVRRGVKLGREGGIKSEEYYFSDIEKEPLIAEEFFSVMTETSDRVSFIQRSRDYYLNILRSLGKYCIMDMLYFDIEGESKRFESGEMSEKERERFCSVIAELESYGYSRNLKKVYLACGLTSYFGKTSICLYGGTRNVLRNILKPSHLLNWIRICRSIQLGCDIHDMGRITGDAYDESNPLFGLCRYKQSYSGDITEYCGDLYLVNGKFRFFMFVKVFPMIKKIKNKVLKKIIKKRTVERS